LFPKTKKQKATAGFEPTRGQKVFPHFQYGGGKEIIPINAAQSVRLA
jgi:hypothetical protein